MNKLLKMSVNPLVTEKFNMTQQPIKMLCIIPLLFTLAACGGGSSESVDETVEPVVIVEPVAVDTDGDGVNDELDAFPNDATETADTDGDGVGDNADTDDDNAGVNDSSDALPNDDTETADTDSDGVGDNTDEYPNDAAETTDTDGDGVGDNSDAFPNDAAETTDTDGDGVGDNSDAFPDDASETTDTDIDGVGNNADTDDDNDGVEDSNDAFPLDATETTDTDGDGVGDNADAFPLDATEITDTDGDGVGDNADAFPLDATETKDTDSDGVGDNTDVDDNDNGLIEISSLEQLDWMRNNLNGTSLNDGSTNNDDGCFITTGCIGYELTQTLDFDTNGDGLMDANDTYFDYDGDDSNSGWLPIGDNAERFTAIFEGNGYEICNLYINRPSTDAETSGQYIGLFGYLDGSTFNAEIRNISLTGGLMSVTGSSNTGGLIGYAYSSSITATYATGAVTGDNTSTGGLIGRAQDDSSITASYATGAVIGSQYTGGLVGYIGNSAVTISYATGAVIGSTNTGGLVGRAYVSSITAGYATGAVTGSSNTAGIVGYASSSSITASYATGAVTGAVSESQTTAGIVGLGANSSMTIIYWATDSSGQNLATSSFNNTMTVDATRNIRATLAQLQCPTAANDTSSCLAGETLYSGWDAIDHDDDVSTDPISPWIFGDGNTLPMLDMSITIP